MRAAWEEGGETRVEQAVLYFAGSGLVLLLREDAGLVTAIVMGGNPAEALPVSLQHLLEGKEVTRANFIVADPRMTPITRNADLYLPYVGIGSLALILGLSFLFSKVPEIEAESLVWVRGAVVGANCLIRSNGDVKVRTLHEARVEARGNVFVERESMEATILAALGRIEPASIELTSAALLVACVASALGGGGSSAGTASGSAASRSR